MLSAAPIFHSNSTSLNKIFLDFDGATVTDSYWTQHNSGLPIHAPVYNVPGDTDYDAQGIAQPFTPQELKYIETAWNLVAEDYAPFNVDVTTEEPPLDYFTKTASNGGRAVRVLFTSRFDDVRLGGTGNNWVPTFDPNLTSGIGASNAWTVLNIDRPVWVFANGFDTVTSWIHPDTLGSWGPIQEYAGTIASHETGHGFGLSHDGDSNHPGSILGLYYGGRPGAGDTSWGAIMGGSELRTLTQWSKGEYSSATNPEDDLAIIADKLGYRADDYGNTTATATLLPVTTGNFSASGIIGGSSGTSNGNDVDMFRFNAGSVQTDIGLYVKPAAVGPNLDIELKIYSASNLATPIATINEPDRIDATYHFTGLGEYYVQIDGVGKGDPFADGYSDYGSLGQYTVLGSLGIPQVTNVTISGTTSLHVPFAFDNATNDAIDFDGSGIQLRTVPVGNANTVEVTFSENVAASILSSHLSIVGLLYGGVPVLAGGGYMYTPSSRTAKWTFSAPFAADQYLISVSDTITDADGNHLDGDWTNPKFLTTVNTAVSRFPSGNGVAGGNFNFVFTILPGDANLNNLVEGNSTGPNLGADYLIFAMYNHEEGVTFTEADFNGNTIVTQVDRTILNNNNGRDLRGLALADWNYSGLVDGGDYNMWRDHQGQTVAAWTLGDANGDGQVTNADYDIWRRQSDLRVTVAV